MAVNDNLNRAQTSKQDEYYTLYPDIENQMNAYLEFNADVFKDKTVLLPCDDPDWSNFTRYFAQNFEKLQLKKLISTSYAQNKKPYRKPMQLSLFELNSPQYDETKTNSHGKIFTLTRRNKRVDINDLQWKYLDGDGSFQSEEVTKLRDESDIIITNPPFSKFKAFVNWIMEADKQFVIIGSQSAITYKEIFPFLRDGKMWLGKEFTGGNAYFKVPDEMRRDYASGVLDPDTGLVKFRNCLWFTNIDHGRRHQPLALMTMADNLKFSKHKKIREEGYPKFDYYDCLNVGYVDAIPSDYEGYLGVPITFLTKHCPEQYDIIGLIAGDIQGTAGIPNNSGKDGAYINGKQVYGRIVIKKRA